MFILDQIPTVAEAQANLNALTQELTLLLEERKALQERLKVLDERLSELKPSYREGRGEIARATNALTQAQAAERWDAAPVVMVNDYWGKASEFRFDRLTAKQIHLFEMRGSTDTAAFSRETGKRTGSRGGSIQDLDRALALGSKH